MSAPTCELCGRELLACSRRCYTCDAPAPEPPHVHQVDVALDQSGCALPTPHPDQDEAERTLAAMNACIARATEHQRWEREQKAKRAARLRALLR